MSNSKHLNRQDWTDKTFAGVRSGERERGLFLKFLESHDFRPNTVRAFSNDLRKFMLWFTERNGEAFVLERLTTRDITDFKTWYRNGKGLAVATVNRSLAIIRKFLGWLVEQAELQSNPAKAVKELRKVELAPKGLLPSEVRRLLREVELRGDIRANAIFSFLLYTGCRVGDLVSLDLGDLILSERSGSATLRSGKGNKQRTVPLPLQCRRTMAAWLEVRPPIPSQRVFVGCRGALTDQGVRKLCVKYSAIIAVTVYPHLLRHTMAHAYLESSGNDLVGLSQILGHESMNTTARYTKRSAGQLAATAERMEW